MRKKILRIGNSLGLILPARFIRILKITENTVVEVTINGSTIKIEVVEQPTGPVDDAEPAKG